MLSGLWVAKIHHLVEQLVNDDKVIPYTLLLKLLEVLGEDLHDLVEKEQDFGSIGVSFCQCKEVEVIMSNVKIL